MSLARKPDPERAALADLHADLAALAEQARVYLSTPPRVHIPTPNPDRPRHALVVDDDDAFLARAVDMLRAAGFRVTVAGSLRDARAALEVAAPIGIALVDLQLPDGNGWDLAEALPAEVRPLMMSARLYPELTRAIARRLGANAVDKGASDADFIAAVEREFGS